MRRGVNVLPPQEELSPGEVGVSSRGGVAEAGWLETLLLPNQVGLGANEGLGLQSGARLIWGLGTRDWRDPVDGHYGGIGKFMPSHGAPTRRKMAQLQTPESTASTH